MSSQTPKTARFEPTVEVWTNLFTPHQVQLCYECAIDLTPITRSSGLVLTIAHIT